MLDMGFEPDMREIIGQAPSARQTLLFTATWPKAVARLAEEFCPRPVRMSLGHTDVLAANPNITQHVEVVKGSDAKNARLQALFTELYMTEGGSQVKDGHGKSIVFVKFKHACNKIAEVRAVS